MEKEFCNYQQSLRLKKLGFDEPCMLFFSKELNMSIWLGLDERSVIINKEKEDEDFLIPTFSQAFRWFRKEYGYWSYLKEATKGTCRFYIEKFDEKFFNSDIIDTYEDAELACLDKLIEIVEGIENTK